MTTKGLEGVVAAETGLSEVYGEEGRLVYRGYEIEDLAENATFEEVCHLLWFGELPTADQLGDITVQLRREMALHPQMVEILRHASREVHPMSVLRTAVSALSWFDHGAEDMAMRGNQRKAIHLSGQVATLTSAIHRLREGSEPLPPRDDLGYAANFLYMLTGQEPDPLSARVMDVALILHAEHSMNASTFSARVTVATFSDIYSGATAAIGTLKGPLHGGANEGVMQMLLEIGEPERAEEWVQETLREGRKVMGFGHRVYRTLDPRAPVLKSLAAELAARAGTSRWLEIAERIQTAMREEMDRRNKQVHPNVDFFSAPLYYTMGIPTELFTNIFACARMPGWTAHMLEQLADNRLIRPGSIYTGPEGRKVMPIQDRA